MALLERRNGIDHSTPCRGPGIDKLHYHKDYTKSDRDDRRSESWTAKLMQAFCVLNRMHYAAPWNAAPRCDR